MQILLAIFENIPCLNIPANCCSSSAHGTTNHVGYPCEAVVTLEEEWVGPESRRYIDRNLYLNQFTFIDFCHH
jgi:hypothetical protein